MALRYDLYAALAGLTSEVLSATSRSQPAEARVAAWEEANASAIHRTRNAIAEFDESRADLARSPCCCARSAPWSARQLLTHRARAFMIR
jgi:NAD-specific glutamate dehydrogenase